MHWRVDEKAAGADRLQALLALRYPIGRVLEMLDLGFTGAERPQLRKLFVGRLVIEISVDHPGIRLRLVRLIGDDDRR